MQHRIWAFLRWLMQLHMHPLWKCYWRCRATSTSTQGSKGWDPRLAFKQWVGISNARWTSLWSLWFRMSQLNFMVTYIIWFTFSPWSLNIPLSHINVGQLNINFPDKLVDECVQNWFCDKKKIDHWQVGWLSPANVIHSQWMLWCTLLLLIEMFHWYEICLEVMRGPKESGFKDFRNHPTGKVKLGA